MTFNRRDFVRLSLCSSVFGSSVLATAPRLLAQGVAAHTVKPVARPAPSGRPFNARFVDVAANAGLHAPVIYGDEIKKYIVESTGCGCAFIDYDNDGWMDLFVLSGTRLEEPLKATNRLYKNNRDGTFTDVTEKAGLTPSGGHPVSASATTTTTDLTTYSAPLRTKSSTATTATERLPTSPRGMALE